MICKLCLQEHFLPAGELCLPCSQKQKHLKDVTDFIKSVPSKSAIGLFIEKNPQKEKEILITDF